MHSSAGDILALLDADLQQYGYSDAVASASDITPTQFAIRSLKKSLFKKFHNNESDSERNKRAWAKFTESNARCARYVPVGHADVDELTWVALNEAKSFIYRFSCPDEMPLLTLKSIEQGVGFGPGANIGAKTGDPYGKLAISDLTYTDPALLALYEHISNELPLWREQELCRAAVCKTKEVRGSRIAFVPKDSEITRTADTQPILNMFFQKGIAKVLTDRLLQVCNIDLRNQPERNRRLCRVGSVTGEFGTLDLSSASDTMSLQLVREWFPDHMVRWLELTRTRQTLYNGAWHDLSMVSTMGNAFTFPLQTIFFTSLVVGAYRALGLPLRYNSRISTDHAAPAPGVNLVRKAVSSDGNFAVFGDDIIVRSESYDLVSRLLEVTGFVVNHDKSFGQGPFRESCGHDYFNGRNVRGVYFRKLLDDLDYYSAYNRLVSWSVRHEVPLPRTISFLASKPAKALYVPMDEDVEAGFHVPYWIANRYLKRNPNRGGTKYTTAKRAPLICKFPEYLLEDCEGKAKRANARADRDANRLKRRVKGWFYNQPGVLNLLLHGNIRDGLWTLRSESPKVVHCTKYTPCWDVPSYVASEKMRSWHDFYAMLLAGERPVSQR